MGLMILSDFYRAARPLLFLIPPEIAHGLTVFALRTGVFPAGRAVCDPALEVTLWERKFPNPIGMAAGFDKDARVVGALLDLGFGHVEAGTVTVRPQSGNPRPRIFRAPAHEAVINRMGFPGAGAAAFQENLSRFLDKQPRSRPRPRPLGLVGINIGMNKDQTAPEKDYCALIRILGSMADYLAVNISSPNTPGLRALQNTETLPALLDSILEERRKSCGSAPPPLLVKLAPDLSAPERESLAQVILESGVDGLILANTTRTRPQSLPESFAAQEGGLSGAPLKDLATGVISDFYRLTQGKIPIIGVGGISTGADAYAKIRAGASLVQVYTSMVYRGPWVAQEICAELLECLRRDGLAHISQAVGAAHRKDSSSGAVSQSRRA